MSNKSDKILDVAWFVLALGIGGLLSYVALVGSPDVCRSVVLKDMAAHSEYARQLSSVLPATDAAGSDFVTALTRGRK